MAAMQHVMTCAAATAAGVDSESIHGGSPDPLCIAIVCEDGGVLLWHSHDKSTIDPGTRLNPDVPAKDWR